VSAGYAVCAVFLGVLGLAIGFVCYRHSRSHPSHLSVPVALKDEEEAVELLDVPGGRSPDMTDFRAVHVRRDGGDGRRKLNGHHVQQEDEDEGKRGCGEERGREGERESWSGREEDAQRASCATG
jgi:hypothetical protein